MYCSLQNFFFKIATIDFNASFPMFDQLLKCFSKFSGQNVSEYLVAGEEDVLVCGKHPVSQLFLQFWKQLKITRSKIWTIGSMWQRVDLFGYQILEGRLYCM